MDAYRAAQLSARPVVEAASGVGDVLGFCSLLLLLRHTTLPRSQTNQCGAEAMDPGTFLSTVLTYLRAPSHASNLVNCGHDEYALRDEIHMWMAS